MIFLFSFTLTYANKDFSAWGNIGVDQGADAVSLLFFGSNFPQGNDNFTTIITPVEQEFFPFVVDLNYDGTNEIYTFHEDVITQFDEVGDIITELTLDNTMCGHGVLLSYYGYLMIGVLSNTSTGYQINLIKNSGGVMELYRSTSYTTGTEHICNLFGGYVNALNYRLDVYFIRNDNKVVTYSPIDDSFTVNDATPPTASAPVKCGGSGLGGCQAYSQRLSTGGEPQLAWFVSGTKKIITWKPISDSYDLSPAVGYDFDDSQVIMGSIGSGATVNVILNQYFVSSSNKELNIFDRDLNLLYKDTFPSGNFFRPTPVICDYDQDGNNELCYLRTSTIACVGNLWTIEQEFNMTDNAWFNSSMACGNYTNFISGYSEIITEQGIFEFNTTSGNMSIVQNFGYDLHANVYPVQIVPKTTFSKDILISTESQLIYYISSGTAGSCGDGNCNAGETIFSCPTDCGVQDEEDTNTTEGSFGHNQVCSDDDDCFGTLICDNFRCLGKSTGVNCSQDFECSSGSCNDIGICDRPDLLTNTDNFFIATGINSTGARLFIGLIIILIGMIIGAGTGATFGGVIGGIILGVAGLLLSAIFVTVVLQLIGIWFLFIIILGLIIIIVLTVMFSGGNG